MKKTASLLILLFVAVFAYGQQTIKSETLESFNSISISGNVQVELIPAQSSSINIQLTDTDIKNFKWNASNGIVNVTLRPGGNKNGRAEVKIYYAQDLTNIAVSGGELIANDTLKSEVLRIVAGGGAKVTAAVETFDLEIEVTGNSAALFTGKTDYLGMRVTERSKADAIALQSYSAEVTANVNAEVYVTASERLVVNAKTGATVFYKGNPRLVKDRTSKISTSIGSSIHNIGK